MAVSLIFKRGFFILFFCFWFLSSYGQSITRYAFTNNANSYTSISGTTIVQGQVSPKIDDVTYTNIPIGFGFWYMGQRYTSVTVSTNGWLSLGTATNDSAPANSLSSGGGNTRPVIAPLWDDLEVFPGILGTLPVAPGNIVYSTSGGVFTVQWTSMKWDKTALDLLGGVISFQVKLSQNGNVQFFYAPGAGAMGPSPSASVGITAGATGSGSFLSLNNLTTGATVSSTAETANIAQRPAGGLGFAENRAYTFDPIEPTVLPTALTFSNVGSTGMTLNWTYSSPNTEVRFAVYRSDGNNTNYVYRGVTNIGVNSYNDIGLTDGIRYYYRVYAVRENLSTTALEGNQLADCTDFQNITATAAAGNNGPVCVGASLTLTATDITGATYSWAGPNGYTAAVRQPTFSYALANSGTYTVTITRNGCSKDVSTTVNSPAAGQWTGAIGTNWNTVGNWCNGVVPTSSVNVTIPSVNVTNNPSITSNDATVNNINVQSGRTLTISGTGNLRIAGAITNNGSIVATAGKVTFNGTTAQTVPLNVFVTNTIKDLEVNNAAGVTLNGALRLTGILTATLGVFNANNLLTLASSETLTAQVAPITAASTSVQGRVKVERFVKGGAMNPYRTYRLLSSPVYDNTTTFINSNVEGNRTINFTQLKDNIVVTGVGGATNGFDEAPLNNPSAWTYTNGAYVPITNINTAEKIGKGLYVFFRGDRTNIAQKINTPFANPENTIVDFEGILNQGDVTVTLPYVASATGFNLIGNPYAATIDWDAPSWGKVNVANSVWMFNPATRSYNTYANGVATGSASQYISSGQSFFVQTTANGSITFKESIKAASQQPTVLLMAKQEEGLAVHSRTVENNYVEQKSLLRVAMKAPGSYMENDVVIVFKENSSVAYDHEDALHMSGQGVNISSLASGGEALAINFLSHGAGAHEIKMGVSAVASGNYLIQFNLAEYHQTHTLSLKDNFLNQLIPITADLTYSFNIDRTNSSSFGTGRFSILVQPLSTLPVSLVDFMAKKQNNGVLLTWATANEVDNQGFKLFRAGQEGSYILIGEVAPKGIGNYSFLDTAPLLGDNYYKLMQVDVDGDQMETKPVFVDFRVGQTQQTIIYPNPVKEKFLIKRAGLVAAKYNLHLHDLSGRKLKSYSLSRTQLISGYEIEVLDLAPGFFLVKLEDSATGEIIDVRKMVKN